MSLKNKAVKGFSWTVFEGVFSQGILFAVGIILARLLTPKDFGLIGIITAFITISNAIVEGGFRSALVRKNDATKEDYNTVFYSNLGFAVFLFILLCFFSGTIADYFGEPQLEKLLIYASTVLIINSFSIIQQTFLIKSLDFKTQGIIAVISSSISGLIAVFMAFQDYGVWSLIALSVLRPLLSTALYWFKSSWKPSLQFSKKSFVELFNFGYKLLVSNILNSLYKNIYYVLIGKYFSPTALGFYTRANQFQAPLSTNIALGIRRISFPVLSTIQDEHARLKSAFVKFIKFSVFINFIALSALAAIAKPLIIILIGMKWETSIYYLQLLCIPGMVYPLQILNLNLLAVKGYSDRYLKLEIIKKFILLPLIFVTAMFSIEVMLYGLIVFSVVEYYINSYYTKGLIGLSFLDQVKAIFPYLAMSLGLFISMYSITFFDDLSMPFILALQLMTGGIFLLVINEIFKFNEYLEVKQKLIQYLKIIGVKNNRKK